MKRSVVTFTTVAFRPVRDFCSIRHQNYYRVTSLFLRFPSKRPAATSVTISLSPNNDSLLRATCTSSATMTSTGAIRPDMKIADSSQSAASKKRKISTQAKFYAVKVGHVPGVYLTWKECEQNITKYKNALFRTFLTRAEADAFVAGHEPVAAISSEVKYYGVAVGRRPGVYTDWPTAQEQVVGWKGPKYRKFATRSEAEAFVRNGGDTSSKPKTKSVSMPKKTGRPPLKYVSDGAEERVSTDEDPSENEAEPPPPSKRPKRMSTKEAEFESQTPQTAVTIERNALNQLPSMANPDILIIYTDGSSLGNGKVGARAGVGVYFGKDDPRNVAERLRGETQTNQRAELTAVLRALEIAPTKQDTHIFTDSRYSIDCVTVWYKNWERNEWQTSLKKPVMNRDLVQGILAKIRERDALGTKTKFSWIKGHSNDPNNEAADRLAVRGAQMA